MPIRSTLTTAYMEKDFDEEYKITAAWKEEITRRLFQEIFFLQFLLEQPEGGKVKGDIYPSKY